MDPDLVRQQEEAQRVASGAAPKPAEASAEPVQVVEAPAAPAFEPGRKPPLPPHWHAEAAPAAEEAPAVAPAPSVETVAEAPEVAPAVEAPVAPVEKAPAPKKAVNPNRRALPPLGRKKVEGEPVKKGFFRGWVKFVVLTLVGALLGAGAGFGAFQYLHLAPEQLNTTLAYGGGAGALLLGLWALLHFDV